MLESLSIKCPLCGGDKARTLLVIEAPDRFERAVGIPEEGYRRRWGECVGCGLAVNVLEKVIDPSVYRETYYRRELEGGTPRERFARIMSLPAEKSDNAGRVARILRFINERPASFPEDAAARILDIGAGTGVFLSRFLDQAPSWLGAALEPNREACSHLRDIRRFEVIEEYFPEGVAGRKFRLVTFNKVLEHIQEPVSFLRGVADNLEPGGAVYVEVPDKLTTRFRPPTDNILGALHFTLFDPATLCLLFQKSGLEPIEIRRYAEPSGKLTVSGFAVPRAFIGEWTRVPGKIEKDL